MTPKLRGEAKFLCFRDQPCISCISMKVIALQIHCILHLVVEAAVAVAVVAAAVARASASFNTILIVTNTSVFLKNVW